MESMETGDYFESYDDLGVHKLMLEDTPRNKAYRESINDNKELFKDKVVLDVGSGTGFLSVLCAQAGARTVYAVEASSVYIVAEELAAENNFSGVIKVMNGRVEDIDIPEKVDIIVSEWMGFYLLHEAMLNSVIKARDKFLKPDGLLFPESATLYSAPCSVPSLYDYWEDVQGVSMTCLASKLREQASKKPVTDVIASDALLSDAEVVVWLDLREVTCEDIKCIEMRHVAVANKEGKYQGICLWFTCTFPSIKTEPVTLSTEPEEPPTHWKQTVIVLPAEVPVELGTPIAYDLSLKQSQENCRRYMIEVVMLDPESVEHPEYCLCHMTKCILVRAMFEKYEKNYLGEAEQYKEKGDEEKKNGEGTEKENSLKSDDEKENCEIEDDGED